MSIIKLNFNKRLQSVQVKSAYTENVLSHYKYYKEQPIQLYNSVHCNKMISSH
jgi:hypothetical protein